ncbi:mas-related G-protein coupled receptor member A1-like [Cervus elaphus]|uniref:mas-related G-protein coupled receptor member A1-like n=1 Tax=Cervus elaphus TaxID=9860 RepID=UPI001CC2CE8C|nr:mas-related G-protein coupled receptor member A1-like [Cervus elaphus]
MDDYCEMNHSSTDAAELAEGSHDVEHVTLRSLTVVVSLCGLAGNGIVIWFVRLSHKKTSFLIYSLNLAIADFMNLSFQILFSVRQILKLFLHRCFGLHALFMVLRWFFYLTGLSIMTAISFQRCLSILFPIWYRCHCPKHLSAIASSQKHQPRKLYLVLLLSFLGFLFDLPLSIIRFYTTEKKNPIFNDICVLLCCVNSTANPAVYFFIGGLQRERPAESLKAVLQRALGEETEDAEDQKVIPAGKTESVGL